MTEDDGLFYIKSVTELGDIHEITVAEDIYTGQRRKADQQRYPHQ